MISKFQKILYVIVAIVISIAVNFSITIINDKLFLENIYLEQASKYLDEDMVDLSKIVIGEIDLVDLNIFWPWYSIAFFYISYLLYWIFLGFFTIKILIKDSIKFLIIVPIVTSAFLFDLAFPIYIVAVFLGSKCCQNLNFRVF